jgi:predicted nucleotidyltransferase
MDISPLLSTKERVKILAHILRRPSDDIVPDRLAREAGVSKSQAHKYAGILRGCGVVKGRRLQETPAVHAIRALLNVEMLERANAVAIIRRHFPGASGIGMFGSFASGTNSEGSDLDIWIKVAAEPSDLEAAHAKRELSGRLGAPVDIVAATPKRLLHLREKSDAFYFSLYNGKVLWGDPL